MSTPSPAATADVDAARLQLARMGLTVHDLLDTASTHPSTPTFAEYLPTVAAAVGPGTRRVYSSYWNRILDHWADRRLDDITPSEIKRLVEHVKHNVVARRNARGGRSAGEHLIAALRCRYRHAEHDGVIRPPDNPAGKVAKPRRLPSTRRAVPDTRLAEINHIAASTGNDPALDTLLLRLHIETACRRGGALALRPQDLDPTQCLIFLREKGQTVRWQPVSPTLMTHLQHHAAQGNAPRDGQLLRYADGRPITTRRYDHLRKRLGAHLPWVATQQISTHWLRHTTFDLGGTQLRVRDRPRLRRAWRRRRRRRDDGHLRASRSAGGRRGAGGDDLGTTSPRASIEAWRPGDVAHREPSPVRRPGHGRRDRSPSSRRPRASCTIERARRATSASPASPSSAAPGAPARARGCGSPVRADRAVRAVATS